MALRTASVGSWLPYVLRSVWAVQLWGGFLGHGWAHGKGPVCPERRQRAWMGSSVVIVMVLLSGQVQAGYSEESWSAVMQVSAGGEHSCGVRSDGSVVCWGLNVAGQAPQPSLVPATLPSWKVGVAVQQPLSLTASGYAPVAPYTFQLVNGSFAWAESERGGCIQWRADHGREFSTDAAWTRCQWVQRGASLHGDGPEQSELAHQRCGQRGGQQWGDVVHVHDDFVSREYGDGELRHS